MSTHLSAEKIANFLGKAKRSGGGFACRCPAHDDNDPSLAIWDDAEGRLGIKCHAGCSYKDVREALQKKGLWPETSQQRASRGDIKKERKRLSDRLESVVPVPSAAPSPDFQKILGWVPTITYEYLNANGNLLMIVARLDRLVGEKQIRPVIFARNGLGKNEWVSGALPAPRPLFGLDQLAANPSAPVLIVEGEKTVLAARALFPTHVVVTWPGGANSVGKADWTPLAGRDVTLWPDNDDPGVAAMEAIAKLLRPTAKTVRIVSLPPELPKGWDLADRMPDGISPSVVLASAPTDKAALRQHIVTARELLAKPLVEPEYLIEKWLPQNGLAMVWAARGLGKTWFALTLAIAVAKGEDFLGYEVPSAKTVLFIDGEMALGELQQRLRWLCPDHLDNLHILPSEALFRDSVPLNIREPDDQKRIIDAIAALESEGVRPALIILDNLSSLTAGIDENDNSALDGIIRWMIGLRHAGVTVLFVHHANKAGDQRGASRREDQLNTSISLKAPDNKDGSANPHDGAHFIMEFTKTRGPKPRPLSMELKLVQLADGRMEWLMSTGSRPSPRDEVLRVIATKKPRTQDEIVQVLHRQKGTVSKDCTALEAAGLIERHPLRLTQKGRDRVVELWPELYSTVAEQGGLEIDKGPI